MGMIAARSERCPVVAKVKLSFGLRQSIHIEAICIEIVCQIIGGKKIYGRRKTCFNANFQQALDNFKWCKAANRVSVRCHCSSAFLPKVDSVQISHRVLLTFTLMYATACEFVLAPDSFTRNFQLKF